MRNEFANRPSDEEKESITQLLSGKTVVIGMGPPLGSRVAQALSGIYKIRPLLLGENPEGIQRHASTVNSLVVHIPTFAAKGDAFTLWVENIISAFDLNPRIVLIEGNYMPEDPASSFIQELVQKGCKTVHRLDPLIVHNIARNLNLLFEKYPLKAS